MTDTISESQNAAQHVNGLTVKEAWWAGYRAGKGLPPDTPRREAIGLPPAPIERKTDGDENGDN